jgi:hypothetical protein
LWSMRKRGRKARQTDGLRVCIDCEEAEPLDQFNRISWCAEGWYGRCRACKNLRACERYHSMPNDRAAEIARGSKNRRLRHDK